MSRVRGWIGVSVEVALDALDGVTVALGLGVPVTVVCVGPEDGDVGQLAAQCGDELGGCREVLAWFADVGVGTQGPAACWREQ